jgi:hypothetical protein
MKRILLVMVIVMLVSTAVSAQLPPQGYFGLFFDASRTNWCYTGSGMITFYFFALPNVDGLKCVEVMAPPPAGFFIFGTVLHADVVQPVMGELATGLVACFGNCWYEWVQVLSATLMIPDENPAEIPIAAFPGSPYPKMLDCLVPDATELEAISWTHLYTNYAECPGYANQESTWGAIKNMYQ